jgi:subtilisin family serine protease
MDPGYASQWGLGAANFLDAWRLEAGRGRVGICVLDTGVDAKHPDLRPRLLRAPDGQYGVNAMKSGASPADDVGHGTHVAGIAAAVAGNSTGIAGAAREPVLNVKVMDAKGGKEADLAQGLAVCARSGARVASMSLHIDKHSPTVERAAKAAQSAGLLLVAAAGNDGSASVRYPAAYPGVLAVGSVSPDAATSPFSNRGPRLDLLAPGDHVVSTFPGGAYRSGSGTSQAVPFVSAAAALVWERAPSLSAADVRAVLLSSARDLGPPGRDAATGWGALDAGAAVRSVG